MNKNHLHIISILFVVSILVAGCSPAGDLSPSTRLVGHWEAASEREDSPEEIYLGELSSDGKGKVYLSYDFVNYCERTYEIISENEDTYAVRFYKDYTSKYEDYSVEFRDDGFFKWEDIDGELIGEFTSVDSETEPDNLNTLADKENEYLTTNSLTGHWVHINERDGKIDENYHAYFGRVDDEGEGVFYASGEESPTEKFSFKIVSEDGRDYDLQFKSECGGDDAILHWEVSKDGQRLKLIWVDARDLFKYIDSNTEP